MKNPKTKINFITDIFRSQNGLKGSKPCFCCCCCCCCCWRWRRRRWWRYILFLSNMGFMQENILSYGT